MHLQQPTPILVIGFNRPNTLKSLLLALDELPEREVWISIDGTRSESDVANVAATTKTAQDWAIGSLHSVQIIERGANLGIYKHCLTALNDFFKIFEVGIVLEDDIQLNSHFARFVDDHHSELLSGKIWSICGHNPISDLTDLLEGHQISFQPTSIHTNWGWATSRKSIERFLNFTEDPSKAKIDFAISRAVRQISIDPFVRLGIRKVWQYKTVRALDEHIGGGWDNFWLIAGWESGLPSLMPTFSLTRENPVQTEGQSHPHTTVGRSWEMGIENFIVNPTIQMNLRTHDVPKLRVWGITRKYCWVYFVRLLKWNPNVGP